MSEKVELPEAYEYTDQEMATKRSSKLIYTCFVLFVYFIGGALKGQEGVSFLDLLILTDTNLERGSLLLTCSAVGFMLGPLVLGFLYDRYNNSALFCFFIVTSGGMTCVIPWCRHLILMSAAFVVRNLLTSAVDIGALVITVKLWKHNVNPFMQAIQAMFALGGIVSPLITAPFLSKTPKGGYSLFNSQSDFENGTLSYSETAMSSGTVAPARLLTNSSDIWRSGNINSNDSYTVHTDVYIAYSIVGASMFVVAVPIFVLWLTGIGDRLVRQSNATDIDVTETQTLPSQSAKGRKSSRLLPLGVILVGFYFFMYGPVEKTSANFLMAFLVKHLGWSKTHASQGSSVFYAGFAGGRFIGIALAFVVPTSAMLFLFMIALVLCLGLFIVASAHSAVFVWVCIVLTGASMSTIYASMYAWVDVSVTPITGKMASAMQVALALGAIASTPLIGYLFEHQTPMWFLYLSIANASLCFLCYCGLYRLSSRHLQVQLPTTEQEERTFVEKKTREDIM